MVPDRIPGAHHLRFDSKTTDKREAREVLKQKYRELEAAKGGFVTMPGPEAKRITVGQLRDELLADYELHGRRSTKGVRSHVKRVREEPGEIRAVDLKAKDLTGYQIARRKADTPPAAPSTGSWRLLRPLGRPSGEPPPSCRPTA